MSKKLSELTEKTTALQPNDLLLVSANGVSKSIKASTVEAPLKSYANAAVETEKNRAESAEGDLADAISSESAERASAVAAESSARASAISSETSARSAAIYAEATRAIAAEGTLSTLINSEISNRNTAVQAEYSRAKSAEDSLESQITAESSARTTADTNLQNQITNIKSNLDPAALDSLTEVVSAFQVADNNLNNAITALASSATSGIATESARAQVAESQLSTSISSETSARQSAVASEISRAQAAEEALMSSVTAESSARASADLVLSNSLALLQTQVNAGSGGSGASSASEVSNSPSNNLSSTNVQSALNELQSDVDFNRNPNRLCLLDGTESISTWSSGNDSTFMSSGTLSGSFVSETSNPIHGNKSYTFTQASGSLNDWFASPAQVVDSKFQNSLVFLTFPYKYDGNSGDIKVVVYDNTNNAVISSDYVDLTGGSVSSTMVSCNIPLTCSSIRIGFQVQTLNSGKVFSFDDLELSTDVKLLTNLANITDYVNATVSSVGFTYSAGANTKFRWKQIGDSIQVVGDFVVGNRTVGSVGAFILPENFILDTAKMGNASTSSTSSYRVGTLTTAGVQVPLVVATTTSTNRIYVGSNIGSASMLTPVADISTIFTIGASVSIDFLVPVLGAEAYNSSVVVANQQVSSSSMTFVFKSAAVLDSDPIGTFNTFTKAANALSGGFSNRNTTAPTQSTASMAADGIFITGYGYTAAGTAATPSRFEIQIGKNLESRYVGAFTSPGKIGPSSYDYMQGNASSAYSGTTHTYTPSTGILIIECRVPYASITAMTPTVGGSAYFTFSASKTPSLVAIPYFQPRIAYVSHQVASGTQGGSAVATTWTTRPLNTLVDSTRITTSLVSNALTLPAGTYRCSGSASFGNTNNVKLRLRNNTNSTTLIVGQSVVGNTANCYPVGLLSGEFTLTAASAIVLQYYAMSALATYGLGQAVGSGENELYAQLEIIKIK